jgi:hypothetical protein
MSIFLRNAFGTEYLRALHHILAALRCANVSAGYLRRRFLLPIEIGGAGGGALSVSDDTNWAR